MEKKKNTQKVLPIIQHCCTSNKFTSANIHVKDFSTIQFHEEKKIKVKLALLSAPCNSK